LFEIILDPTPVIHDGAEVYQGSITLGEFREAFLASALLWRPSRYQTQWRTAATSLVRGASRSAFITSFLHPDAHHNVIWPAWRVGSQVYIQNRLVLREQIGKIFEPDRVDELVGERAVTSDEGLPISEWSVTLEEIAAFAA